MTVEPEMLTLTQAAALVSYSPRTLRRWRDGGRLTAYAVPGTRGRRYRRDDVLRLLTPADQPGEESSDA